MILRLALVSILLLPTLARGASTEEMISSCRKFVASLEGDKGKQQFVATYESGLCVGAFTTLHSLSGLILAEDSYRIGLCPSDQVTFVDFIWVFLEHVRKNPNDRPKDYLRAAYPPLRAAYPCGAERKYRKP